MELDFDKEYIRFLLKIYGQFSLLYIKSKNISSYNDVVHSDLLKSIKFFKEVIEKLKLNLRKLRRENCFMILKSELNQLKLLFEFDNILNFFDQLKESDQKESEEIVNLKEKFINVQKLADLELIIESIDLLKIEDNTSKKLIKYLSDIKNGNYILDTIKFIGMMLTSNLKNFTDNLKNYYDEEKYEYKKGLFLDHLMNLKIRKNYDNFLISAHIHTLLFQNMVEIPDLTFYLCEFIKIYNGDTKNTLNEDIITYQEQKDFLEEIKNLYTEMIMKLYDFNKDNGIINDHFEYYKYKNIFVFKKQSDEENCPLNGKKSEILNDYAQIVEKIDVMIKKMFEKNEKIKRLTNYLEKDSSMTFLGRPTLSKDFKFIRYYSNYKSEMTREECLFARLFLVKIVSSIILTDTSIINLLKEDDVLIK
ncbi:hypothetical protein A0H76_2572 [Hepatospora eriocheir]|uniref:Uncharacterized protein n=1 Tax=Hepatospora eriocheir TaxID=1081669 RepID=A0A1X0QF88_9MICR|nr:hypothetical protein A0H76_2572 [Hepatospora eriocheir]